MCMSDMAVAGEMKGLMHWFCGQENKLVLTGISPSDENSQTVGQCLICREIGQVPGQVLRRNPYGWFFGVNQTCRGRMKPFSLVDKLRWRLVARSELLHNGISSSIVSAEAFGLGDCAAGLIP